MMRLLLIVIAGLVLAGCSGPEILNGLSPEIGLKTSRDIAYGKGPGHRLDVYAPRDARGAPIVVFFYGGSWQNGEKSDYAFVGRALAERGIVVVVPNYRLYPQVRFAGFMQDGAHAVAWARRHAVEFGGDPGRLVLMGHSAGAHIAALLTLDPRWLAADGLDTHRDIAGMVGLAGPYDFLPIKDPKLKVIFGPPARLSDTQPITFVDGRNPLMFLATDAGDPTVEPRNTYSLADKIRSAGGPVETKTYEGLTHATLIGVVSEPLGFTSPVRQDATSFILAAPRTNGGRAP